MTKQDRVGGISGVFRTQAKQRSYRDPAAELSASENMGKDGQEEVVARDSKKQGFRLWCQREEELKAGKGVVLTPAGIEGGRNIERLGRDPHRVSECGRQILAQQPQDRWGQRTQRDEFHFPERIHRASPASWSFDVVFSHLVVESDPIDSQFFRRMGDVVVAQVKDPADLAFLAGLKAEIVEIRGGPAST